ncbi:MAG TPA: effector binding domain-containing protein [Nitrospinota bacterium]|nr:effector binding domain-containing protein [Nitrospinota bacterium]
MSAKKVENFTVIEEQGTEQFVEGLRTEKYVSGPKLVTGKEGMKLVGLKVVVDNKKYAPISKAISNLWKEFGCRIKEIKGAVNPRTCYGVDVDISSDKYGYFAGIEVSDIRKVPEGMEYMKIPASDYLMTTHKGSLHNVMETFENLNNLIGTGAASSYCKSPGKCGFMAFDNNRFTQGADSEVDVYVAVNQLAP